MKNLKSHDLISILTVAVFLFITLYSPGFGKNKIAIFLLFFNKITFIEMDMNVIIRLLLV